MVLLLQGSVIVKNVLTCLMNSYHMHLRKEVIVQILTKEDLGANASIFLGSPCIVKVQ